MFCMSILSKDQIVELVEIVLDGREIRGCPHTCCHKTEPKGSGMIIERVLGKSLFEPCKKHAFLWINPEYGYRRIK